MIRVCLFIITMCYLANTVAVYHADGGGVNIYFGNFGYHFGGD